MTTLPQLINWVGESPATSQRAARAQRGETQVYESNRPPAPVQQAPAAIKRVVTGAGA
ncbi:hypothetical protein [Ottowia sp.]|uniref:hypothetical protein n=1 Tax=Ottowia sp. TaxID=1898956 RepID=UPI0039E2B3FD